MVIALTIITGLIYPLGMTFIAQLAFPYQANGSLVTKNGAIIGSALIGQKFTSERYFHGRPSAAGNGYDAADSGASNLGPTSAVLIERIEKDVKALRQENPDAQIPMDMITTSGSGLDPHISLAAADFQVPRIARARGVSKETIYLLVERHIEKQALDVMGENMINVLALNMALDNLVAP